jgi:hypothetical protein
MRPSLKFLAHEVDLPKAGNNPQDQPDKNKNIVVKNRGQPVADAETDHYGEDQDHADGAGPVTPLKQFL